MKTHRTLVALAATLMAGCASDGINPYSTFTRDDGVEVKAGNLIVVVAVEDAAGAESVEAALASTLAPHGASVKKLGGRERAFLLDYLRVKNEDELRADLRHYEGTIVARIRDPLAAMRIAWTMGKESVWLDIDGRTAKLLDQGPNRYKLIVDAKRGQLVVSGNQLVRSIDGKTFSFKTPPFRLYLKEENQRIKLRLHEETAKLWPEQRLAFLKISGYTGDTNALFGSLVGEDLGIGEDGPRVRLVHLDTVLLFSGSVVSAGDGNGDEGHDDDDEGHDGDDDDDDEDHHDESDKD